MIKELNSEHQKILKQVVELAIKNVKEEQELLPTVYINGIGGLHVVATRFDDPESSKDQFSEYVRKLSRSLAADMVIFISEAWTLQDEAAVKDYMANKHKYPFGVVQHPKRRECMTISVETNEGDWSGSGFIIDREVWPITWYQPEQATGRFANLRGGV